MCELENRTAHQSPRFPTEKRAQRAIDAHDLERRREDHHPDRSIVKPELEAPAGAIRRRDRPPAGGEHDEHSVGHAERDGLEHPTIERQRKHRCDRSAHCDERCHQDTRTPSLTRRRIGITQTTHVVRYRMHLAVMIDRVPSKPEAAGPDCAT